MGNNNKSFDQMIADLRRGKTGGVRIGPDGSVLRPEVEVFPGPNDSPGSTSAPTVTRDVVWGAWWDNPRTLALFDLEREVMAQRFPAFEAGESRSRPGSLAWQGALSPFGQRDFHVEVVHRPAYLTPSPRSSC